MEGINSIHSISPTIQRPIIFDGQESVSYAQETVTLNKQDYIELIRQSNYWKAQHKKVKEELDKSRQKTAQEEAKNKDLHNRLFGHKSEKDSKQKSKKHTGNSNQSSTTPRGQQSGSQGHGRTTRPNLPIVNEQQDLAEDEKACPDCGLPHKRTPGLDEESDVIEVEVSAHVRRIKRHAYTPHPSCSCEGCKSVIIAPAPIRLIPKSPYSVSLWVEVILGKYRYGQPSNRYLTDLKDQGLPVSAGTLAGGLKQLFPLFEPIQEALYCQQMQEDLFHNDETRWEVFVDIEGKVGSRWYLWVTRSQSVIYYCIDPSRSAAVPGAHFAGLQRDRVIIVCDRYSAYKKLARLSDVILLAYCWAHVRRDFLDAGRSYKNLEDWALEWKQHIATLYHLNKQRRAQWSHDLPIFNQTADFYQTQYDLQAHLNMMYAQAHQVVTQIGNDNIQAGRNITSLAEVTNSAEKQQIKVYRSLLNHWQGLTLFVQNPQVPLDNNPAENAIRNPVTGRSAYAGSSSIWSAELSATLFSITQTLLLWDINPRHWLHSYLTACAENAGKPPQNIQDFIPWQMSESTKAKLSKPKPLKQPKPP